MSDSEQDNATKRVDEALASLGEFFDAVIIMGSFVDEDSGLTRVCFKGKGNQFSREGMARHYLIANEAKIRYDAEQECRREDTDAGE